MILPHDDPTAMGTMCSVLHGNNRVPHGALMGIERFSSLATLSHKYSCDEALRPAVSSWLKTISRAAATPGYETLLALALQFKSPEVFHKTSIVLIHSWEGSFSRLAEKGNLDSDVFCTWHPKTHSLATA